MSYIFLYACECYLSLFSMADRLVDCATLKRALEIVYSATLPKASKPFIYMSIIVPLEHVDVNVHPTKREVNASFISKIPFLTMPIS